VIDDRRDEYMRLLVTDDSRDDEYKHVHFYVHKWLVFDLVFDIAQATRLYGIKVNESNLVTDQEVSQPVIRLLAYIGDGAREMTRAMMEHDVHDWE
jgi:hypothetical protein